MLWGMVLWSFCVHSIGGYVQFSQLHLFRKTILSPFDCLGMLAENQLTRNMKVYFSTLNSIPLSILMLVPCYLYCSIVVNFEIGKCESSNSFFFKIVFIFRSFVFPYELQDQLVNFCKIRQLGFSYQLHWINLGNTAILTRWCLLIQEYGTCFHLFRFSLISLNNIL